MTVLSDSVPAIIDDLKEICVENEILDADMPEDVASLDLAKSGHFDSMTLVFLQNAIAERWGVDIAPALFVTKLRTVADLAAYIAAHRKA